jgi:hypothetical protein
MFACQCGESGAKGLTKRTLFGIVLFKMNIFLFHVFLRSLVLILPVPHVRGVYRGSNVMNSYVTNLY